MPRKPTGNPAGRPLTGPQRKQAYNVMLTPSVAEKLRELGKDENGRPNLSRGIARALRAKVDQRGEIQQHPVKSRGWA